MSNKNKCFENKEYDSKNSLSKSIIRPISNLVSTSKISKDNQKHSKNFNGSINKLVHKPPNLNLYKNSNLEPKKNLQNSKSNSHLNSMLEEDLKRACNFIENNKKMALFKGNDSKNSAYYENENISAHFKNSKEAIDFGDAYNYSNQNQSLKNAKNNNLPNESNSTLVDKTIPFLKPQVYYSNNSNYLSIEENRINLKEFLPTSRNVLDAKKYDKELHNTFSNPMIGNFHQNNNKVFVNKNSKPSENNLSMNLIKNNFLNKINNKNSIVNNAYKKADNKNSFISNNLTGGNKHQFKNNSSNPTVLRGGFIMAAMEDKKNKAELINKNTHSKFNSEVFPLKESQIINQNASSNLRIQNYKTLHIKNISNNEITGNKFITNQSQNNFIDNIQKKNKNRSESFNNLKFGSYSLKYNHKRHKSHTFNELMPNSEFRDIESNYLSIDKKNFYYDFQKKVSNLNNESKSLSILDLKKRYNQVIKKKKIPTSLLIKSN